MPALASPQLWAWITIALAAGFLVWLLSPILAPFLFAAILAYIFDPLVERLTHHRVPPTLAVVLVLLLAVAVAVALMLVVLPLFYKETRLLMEKLPGFVAWFNAHAAPWLKARLDLDVRLDVENATQLGKQMLAENEQLAKHLLTSLKTGGMVLVTVVLFYLLRDWNLLLDRVDVLIPRRVHAKARAMAAEVDAVLAQWLRGQVLVIATMSVYYVLALWLARLEFAIPIGILTGLAVIVPYVGVVTGLILAERMGLHPVVVIFALLAFGQVFGFFGVLLALPASAALLVGVRHLRAAYLASRLYGGN